MTGLRAAATITAATVIGVTACAPPQSRAGDAAVPPPRVVTTPAHQLLATAVARGIDTGPVAATAVLHLTLALRGRDQAGLDALLATGQRLTPFAFASRFGPDPVAVAAAETLLRAGGLTTGWQNGATTLAASGTARSVDSVFDVRIDNRIGPDGVHFFAPAQAPVIPSAMRNVVSAVFGLDNYPRATASAIRTQQGVSPSDMLDFYDVMPLRTSGLDGSGMTVAFPEIDRFDPAMLNLYAQKFHLPPFDVHVKASFGNPDKEQGEADLDLEIVHAIAPGATEVVYYASSSRVLEAEQQMYRDYPQGAIESSSVGECEDPQGMNRNDATLLGTMQQAAAAQGWSMMVATGDRGAYDCAPEDDFKDIAADLDASIPYVTAVGGTLVFLSANGGFYKEAAWGEPIEQWGSSGGLSEYWPLPSWQRGPGVHNQYSNGMRETPDISGNADSESGWDVFAQGDEQKVGGTSAAAPFWAGCIALIDQDLKSKGLPPVGFANPALYLFAQNPSGLPAQPYHDVTAGTNLYYPATPGYDLATGWGSADIGALALDFEWFARSHPLG